MSAVRLDTPVGVIISSTRPTRICPEIAGWVQRALGESTTVRYELIDLAEINLPLLDEPLMGALGEYRHDHTRAWSELVDSHAGFIFVLPQYNWGYPAALKNALDYLYHEWHGKPVTTVTYGTRGGNRAADQIRQVFEGLHMLPLPGRVELKIGKDDLDDAWQLADLEATMAPYRDQFREIDAQMVAALQAAASPGDPAAT